jgi:hypothetical protein
VKDAALRWCLAAAATAALLAGLRAALGNRPVIRPGAGARALLSSGRDAGKTRGKDPAVRVAGSVSLRRGDREARPGPIGLGARLIDAGKPRGPLVPLAAEAEERLPPAAEHSAVPAGAIRLPPTAGESSAARRRSAEAARRVRLGLQRAPKPRKIPRRGDPRGAARRAIDTRGRPPRLPSAPAPAPVVPVAEAPPAEAGAPVAPRKPRRLPAPIVPLP